MRIKYVWVYSLIAMFFLMGFTQCSSSKTNKQKGLVNLEEKPSFILGDVFFRKWVAGVEGGGSGYHFYMMVKENKRQVVFDSVYFRGLKAKLTIGKMGYLASFKTALNQKKDINMSANSLDEYGNMFPHELLTNECVLSYYEKDKIKYFKIENLKEKEAEYYPSTPPNQQ
jgi:hypothetical protein